MRLAANVDGNQAEIVEGLRNLGYRVYVASRVGGGFPDLVVSNRTDIWLMEVKTEKGALNEKQLSWIREWETQGKPVLVVRSVADAVQQIRFSRREATAHRIAKHILELALNDYGGGNESKRR